MEKQFYTVVWTKKARQEYEISKKDHGIITMEDSHGLYFNINEGKKGRPKIRGIDVYPIFGTKKEAESYRENNPDWETIEINIDLPNLT